MGCASVKATMPTTATATPEELPKLLGRSKGDKLSVGYSISEGTVAAVTAVGHGATSAATAVGSGAQHIGCGAVHGAVDALTAVGHSAQHVGSGAAGVVHHAGHGAVSALVAVGHGAQHVGSGAAGAVWHVGHEAAEVVKSVGHFKAAPAEPQVQPEIEKTWYERVCDCILSLDPRACCCQPAAGSNLLGSLVKSVVETFDASMLGVEVRFGTLVIDAAIGRMEVDGLTVFNPEGFQSEYLLHARKVVVDIDMEKLLYSFGKELHVEELIFDGIDVIYERGCHGSNLQALMKKLESDQQEQAASPGVKLVLHSILAQNIGAKLTTTLTQGHGFRVEVASLRYDDFDTEKGARRGLMAIVHILISTLIKSVLATVVGKHGTEAIVGAAHGVTDKFMAVGSGSVDKVKAVSCGSLDKIKAVGSGSMYSLKAVGSGFHGNDRQL